MIITIIIITNIIIIIIVLCYPTCSASALDCSAGPGPLSFSFFTKGPLWPIAVVGGRAVFM